MELVETPVQKSYRILVVDDDVFIHRTYQTILTPRSKKAVNEAALQKNFKVDYCESGESAIDKAIALKESGEVYALAFVDMALGFGIDGLETIKRLWKIYPELEIVFCTGNDNKYWKEAFNPISETDRLVVLKKPFDTEEVRQLARSLTAKWAYKNDVQGKLKLLEQQVQQLNETDSALQKSQDNLKASFDKLEQFASIVSHDLQAPVRSTNFYLDFLETECGSELSEAAQKYINHIKGSNGRLGTMISELLRFCHVGIKPEDLTTFDLSEVIDTLQETLAASINTSHAKLHFEDLSQISADKPLIERMLQNLVENAIKYNENAKPDIDVSMIDEAQRWVISVKDNGFGIPDNCRESIFEVFRRVNSKNKVEGTGMGLAICQRIANAHNGAIWVESSSENGSDIRFSISKTII